MNFRLSWVTSFRSHPVVKGTTLVFVGSMAVNFFSYLYHFVVGRVLGPAQYGELAAMLSIFYILNVPSNILQTVLVKYFSINKANNDDSQSKALILATTKRMSVVLSIIFLCLIPFLHVLSDFLHITNQWYFVWLYLTVCFFLLGTVQLSAIQGNQLFVWSTSLMTAGTLVRLGLGAVAAFFGVGWSLVANMMTNVFGFMVYFLPLRKIYSSKTVPLKLSQTQLFSYSIPSMLATLGVTSLYSSDVVLVKHFLSMTDAGLYSSLSVLGKVVFFASAAIGFVIFPILAEYKELGRSYGRVVLLSLFGVGLLSFGVTLLYFLFPTFVIQMLFGSAFEGSSVHLGNFGLFISFFSLSNLLTNISLAISRTKVWIATMTAAIVQILLLWNFHDTISQVITNNLYVTFGLFVTLLLYYVYETRKA